MKTLKLTYFVLAVATGLAVSGIYLNQSILGELAHVFQTQASVIGLLATITQIGYALGIFFLVPLGDIVNKKQLATRKMLVLSLGLLAIGASTSLWQLFAASFVVGIFASVAQDFVPIAAEIAPAKERGKVVGLVMSGLLIGILASRTVSGWIETQFDWRWVFWSFSILIALFLGAVFLLLPSTAPAQSIRYAELMKKLIRLPLSEPLLTRSLITHGLVGFAFSAFWTNLSFHLSEPEFQFSTLQIGLFGLAGAAGALVAPLAGKISDSRGPVFVIRLAVLLVIASFAWMFALPSSILALILGAIVFDAGTQMSLISHQSIIYSLDASSRSSLNAVFVTGMFISFALGSAISTNVYGGFGWRGVMALALLASGAAMIRTLKSVQV